MAGYSATPLPAKLGLKPGHRVRLVGDPPGFRASIGVIEEAEDALDLAVVLADRSEALLAAVADVRPRLRPSASLWIGWPKKASRRPTDITEDRLREWLLPTGLVDTKVCAIDEVWSGLRFVLRRELRA